MQVSTLTGLRGFAVVGDAGFAGSEDELVGRGIADSAGDGNAVFDHRNRNAKLWNALYEFPSAVERVDNPDAAFVEASEVVNRFFREPALAWAQQVLFQDGVHGMIGLGDWVGADFVFRLDVPGRKAVQDRARLFEGGVDAFQSLFNIRGSHNSFQFLVF